MSSTQRTPGAGSPAPTAPRRVDGYTLAAARRYVGEHSPQAQDNREWIARQIATTAELLARGSGAPGDPNADWRTGLIIAFTELLAYGATAPRPGEGE